MERLVEVLQRAKPETDIEDFLKAKDLYGQGVIDSLDVMVIIEELCTEFDIEITAADVRRSDFLTVDSIYAFVERMRGVV